MHSNVFHFPALMAKQNLRHEHPKISEREQREWRCCHIATHFGATLGVLLAILLTIPIHSDKSVSWTFSADGCARGHLDPFQERSSYILRSSRVVLPNGQVTAADVGVGSNGKIMFVDDKSKPSPRLNKWLESWTSTNLEILDVSPLVVMPGLIDPHVHVNAPGKSHWEGYESASRAAALGGTTTILDMPLNNVPSTISLTALAAKAKAIESAQPIVDVGLIAGVIPSNLHLLRGLLDAGVVAFKSFMIDSQSPDFPHVTVTNLSNAMHTLAHLKREYASRAQNNVNGVQQRSRPFPPYILHAELPPESYEAGVPYDGDFRSYASYLQSRPDSWEINAIREALRLSNTTHCRVHIAHISSAAAANLVEEYHAFQKPAEDLVTSETCAQYLLWSSEDIPDGRTEFKCAPPIRSNANRLKLWSHVLKSSGVQMVASDHSPAPPQLKKFFEGDFKTAWGGISGLQYRLQATWTAMRELNNSASFASLTDLLSSAPARHFGLAEQKGAISPGLDADFVIWDPEASAIVREADCEHRFRFSPFAGMNLSGQVYWSLLRGKVLYSKLAALQAKDGFPGVKQGRVLVRNARSGLISPIPPKEFANRLSSYL